MPQYINEEEEEQTQAIPRGISAPIPGPPEEDFFKFRIDGSDILEDIEHQLKGETINETTGKYEPRFDRWINDEGINKVLHIIYACGINKNIFLGNLTKDEIMFKCKSIKKKLALLFFKKYYDYEVPKEMRSLLITTIVNQIHSGLSRSEGGRESEQLSTASLRHDIYSHQDQKREGGGFFTRFARKPIQFGQPPR